MHRHHHFGLAESDSDSSKRQAYRDMPFQSRNCFYLRISATNVIPLYIYLDDRHIEWMTDRTLQHVISDLRPLLAPKLKAEANAHLGPGGPANAKRGTVEVHRGDNYQFAYFLRKADTHAVILKNRDFVMMPHKPKPTKTVEKQTSSKKRKVPAEGHSSTKRPRKCKKAQIRRSSGSSEDEELEELSTSDDGYANNKPRRSNRNRGKSRANYLVDSDDPEEDENLDERRNIAEPEGNTEPHAVQVKIEESDGLPADKNADKNESQQAGPSNAIELVDDEDEKMKPILRLHYKGFSIYGRCLCVVVEPYHPMRASTRAPSSAPQMPPPARTSVGSPDYSGFDMRASVPPLFLPDYEREESVIPVQAVTRRMSTPPLTFDDEDEEEDGFGMMAFSQVLNSVSGEGKGGIDEDDDIDGGVFFGDADEARDL